MSSGFGVNAYPSLGFEDSVEGLLTNLALFLEFRFDVALQSPRELKLKFTSTLVGGGSVELDVVLLVELQLGPIIELVILNVKN